jgi:hypothetical protein
MQCVYIVRFMGSRIAVQPRNQSNERSITKPHVITIHCPHHASKVVLCRGKEEDLQSR